MVKTVISPEDMEQAEEYALRGCQNGTIAGLMEWADAFISDRPDIRKRLTKKRQERKYKLRVAQDDKALVAKDTTMLIFLGKNDLGQSDQQDTNLLVGKTIADIFALIAGQRRVKQVESVEKPLLEADDAV